MRLQVEMTHASASEGCLSRSWKMAFRSRVACARRSLSSMGAVLYESPVTTNLMRAPSRDPARMSAGSCDAEPHEGDQSCDHTQHCQDGQLPPAPTNGDTRVQEHRIQHPNEQAHRVERIPRPRVSAQGFRIERAGNQPEGHQWEAPLNQLNADAIERVECRQVMNAGTDLGEIFFLLRLQLALLHQVDGRYDAGDGERRVAEKCER